jgi:hypothetical protein|tara:strand:- start:11 stop:343 length:333 start_codon:yes stop_codon:yes gene_type:complete
MGLKFYTAIFSSVILVGASHLARNFYEGWQENKLDEIRIAELLADKDRELALKDLQLIIAEDSNATLVAENKWAKRHVAQREEQISQLREGFSDEINICLDTYIDPVFAP